MAVRRNSDDENPFDDIFDEVNRMMDNTADEAAPIDVHEHDEQITVVADVPGVERSDIDLHCDGRTLAIRAVTETGRFVRRVDLPSYVDEQSTSASYNNGVLEVTLARENDPANIGFY